MLIEICNFEVLSEFSCFKHCIYVMNIYLQNTIMLSKKSMYIFKCYIKISLILDRKNSIKECVLLCTQR